MTILPSQSCHFVFHQRRQELTCACKALVSPRGPYMGQLLGHPSMELWGMACFLDGRESLGIWSAYVILFWSLAPKSFRAGRLGVELTRTCSVCVACRHHQHTCSQLMLHPLNPKPQNLKLNTQSKTLSPKAYSPSHMLEEVAASLRTRERA